MVDEAVDNAFGSDHVVEYLAPVFEGPVGCNDIQYGHNFNIFG